MVTSIGHQIDAKIVKPHREPGWQLPADLHKELNAELWFGAHSPAVSVSYSSTPNGAPGSSRHL